MTDIRTALQALLVHYVEMVNSGDCGFWNTEDEDVVKDARAALAAPTAKGGTGAGWTTPHKGPVAKETEAAARRIAARRAGDAYCDADGVSEDAWRCEIHVAEAALWAPPPPAGAAGGGSGDLGPLSAGATPGPWYVEREPTDGSYGSGEDCYEGYDAFTILTEAEKHYGAPGALFNSHNSTVGCVETESNEDDFSAWDAVAKANAEFVVALVNAYRSGRLVEASAPTPDLGAQGEPVAMEGVAFYAWRCREGEGSRQRWASAIQHKELYPGGYDDRSVTAAYEAATDILALLKVPAAPRTGSGVSVEKIAREVFIANNVAHDGTPQSAVEDWSAGIFPRDRDMAFKAARAILALIAQAPRDGGETQGADAERFRALMRCGRIKMQGSAGVDPKTGERTYAATPGRVHFGAEFWPVADAKADIGTIWGRHCLRALADDILALEATPPSGVETIRQDSEGAADA